MSAIPTVLPVPRPRQVGFVANNPGEVERAESMTFDSLAHLLGEVKAGKKAGHGWVPADIPRGRRLKEQVRSVSWLVFDVEARAENVKGADGEIQHDDYGDNVKRIIGPEPPAFDELIAELEIRGWRACLHTSYSHSLEHSRYRVVFDISRTITPGELQALTIHLAGMLGLSDCYDNCSAEASRLYYLPRCPEPRLELFQWRLTNGDPLPIDTLLHDAQRAEEALRKALERATARQASGRGEVIEKFNAHHDVGKILERNGYLSKGRGRWLHPDSTTGDPGVRLLPESTAVYSSHGNCALNDGHAHDAFDVYRLLEHGGVWTSSVKAAARELGMDSRPSLTVAHTSTPAVPAVFVDPSEDEIALEFVHSLELPDRPDVSLRYCAEWSKWMRWKETENRWERVRDLAAFDMVRSFLRGMSANNADTRFRKAAGKAAVIAAIERLAQADRQCATVPEDWDAHKMLLNTPVGVVNLETGDIQPCGPANANLLLSKQAIALPGGECRRWRHFLDVVTGGDTELQSFLARVAGYCLTASTREHALFFFYGTGGNGKGVFLNTLCKVLGDYAAIAPMSTFIASHSDRHPTELASLRGARLVVAQETDEGRSWDESRIKALTGGDPIAARFMRGDFFTFTPEFKLLIAGNHKPRLKSVDEAMRRRLHLIPFAVTIQPDQRNPELAAELLEEADGILAWALEGCLEWQRIGLSPPSRVRDMTADYFEAEDAFQTWIGERCDIGPNRWELPAILFSSWKQWAEKAGEPFGTQRTLGDRLEAAGYQRRKANGTRQHLGLSLKQEHAD